MTLIDATGGKFTQKRFNEFCSHIKVETETILVIFDEQHYNSNFEFNALRQFLEMDEVTSIFEAFKDTTCSFVCDNATLTVDVNDVLWWLKQKNGVFVRLDKLFSEAKIDCANEAKSTVKKEKSVSTSAVCKVVAGIQTGSTIEDVELFEGTNKDAISFINKYYSKYIIRSKFGDPNNVKFVINYENDDELSIPSNWKTFEELESEGLVKLV